MRQEQLHKAPNEKPNMLWKKPENCSCSHGCSKKNKKTSFCSRILFSTHQPGSFSGVVSQSCCVIGQKFWVAGINMEKEISFLIAQGFNGIGQFWTEWTQKLRACLLCWEGPDVGVWHLSYLGHIHFPGQKELWSWTKISRFLWIT